MGNKDGPHAPPPRPRVLPMPPPKKTAQTIQFDISIEAHQLLRSLLKTGLYGKRIEEIAERLLMEKLREELLNLD